MEARSEEKGSFGSKLKSNSWSFAIVAIDLLHGALSWWKSTFFYFFICGCFLRFLPSNSPIMLFTIDSSSFLKVINEQNTLRIPKYGGQNFACWCFHLWSLWTCCCLLSWLLCPVGWSCRIHRLLLCREVRHPSTRYDTNQSDGRILVMVEFWGIRRTSSSLSLSDPLWPGLVASGLNRTKLCTYAKLNYLK